MARHITVEAVILAHRRTTGQHRQVVLLSPQVGMVEASAFGAKKGSLTGRVSQFLSGTALLYHNPVRNYWTIEDFTPEIYRNYIAESLEGIYTASFFSECIMKTYAGGGEYEQLYHLVGDCLDGLSVRQNRELVVVQFVWRYLIIAGFLSDARHCSSCARVLTRVDPLFFDLHEQMFVCTSCNPGDVQDMEISPGARAYLDHTAEAPLADALKVRLESGSLEQLKRILLSAVDSVTDGYLNTLRSMLI